MKILFLKIFLGCFFISLGFAQQPQKTRSDQDMSFGDSERRNIEKLFEDFFQGDSFKLMQERMETLFEQMEEDMQKYDSLLKDENLNNLLRGSGIFGQLDHGQHNWMETKDQRILVLKIEGQEDSPIEITVENGKVQVQGRVKTENIQETPRGTTKSVSVREINKIYLIPDDCDPESVQIENKAGEILVKFSKIKGSDRKPLKPQEDQETI